MGDDNIADKQLPGWRTDGGLVGGQFFGTWNRDHVADDAFQRADIRVRKLCDGGEEGGYPGGGCVKYNFVARACRRWCEGKIIPRICLRISKYLNKKMALEGPF